MSDVRTIRSKQDLKDYMISTRLLLEIALDKGYSVTFYPSSPSTKSGIARCSKNGKEFFLKSTCAFLTPSLGVFAAENKCLTHSLLSGDVNVPNMVSMNLNQNVGKEILDFFHQYKKVVVKPAAMNHGDGITIGIESEEALHRAIDYVRSISPVDSDVIVQEQVYGKEYRFLVVSGKVVAVAHRRPPFVEGDGLRSITELIDEKNEDPRRGDGHASVLTKISLEDVKHHNRSGFLDEVPAKGEIIEVLATSNLSRGGESVDYTDIASKELKKMAIKAADLCFLGVAGVDIMTDDITSNSTDGSYVIEVNLTPGIRMHEAPSEGKPRRVSETIFKAIEKTARSMNAARPLPHIGRVETVKLPNLTKHSVHARVDTGATYSTIWASDIRADEQGLSFTMFDKKSEHYTGEVISVNDYQVRSVSSSMGQIEKRYLIKTPILIGGKKVLSSFTLADRSSQTYPMLIGRNVLRHKFIVDVSQGKVLYQREKDHRKTVDRKGGI